MKYYMGHVSVLNQFQSLTFDVHVLHDCNPILIRVKIRHLRVAIGKMLISVIIEIMVSSDILKRTTVTVVFS